LTTWLVRPVSIVSHLNLNVNSFGWNSNHAVFWRLDDSSSVDFVSTSSFPGLRSETIAKTLPVLLIETLIKLVSELHVVEVSSPWATSWTWTIKLSIPSVICTFLLHSKAPLFHLLAPSIPCLFIIHAVNRHGWRLVLLIANKSS